MAVGPFWKPLTTKVPKDFSDLLETQLKYLCRLGTVGVAIYGSARGCSESTCQKENSESRVGTKAKQGSHAHGQQVGHPKNPKRFSTMGLRQPDLGDMGDLPMAPRGLQKHSGAQQLHASAIRPAWGLARGLLNWTSHIRLWSCIGSIEGGFPKK